MYDKIENEQSRKTLKALLGIHSEAFLEAEKFYTSRDRLLVAQYGGRLFVNHV